jgi:hypothetical protein
MRLNSAWRTRTLGGWKIHALPRGDQPVSSARRGINIQGN